MKTWVVPRSQKQDGYTVAQKEAVARCFACAGRKKNLQFGRPE